MTMNNDDELEKLYQELADELSKSINEKIINKLLFDNKVKEWKAINREGQIDSILFDKPFTPIIIEETKEYKLLDEKDKEKYKKFGKVIDLYETNQ